jgi:hypothetical protein
MLPQLAEVMMRSGVALFFLALTFGVTPALAQFDSASVVGTVSDASGALIAGAKVTLTNAGTGISLVKTTGAKTFALGGPAKFEFRLEAFNLLNRTNFRAPNGNRSAGAFGTITSTLDPRQLQLGFKFLW